MEASALTKITEDVLEQIDRGFVTFGVIGDDPDGLALFSSLTNVAPGVQFAWYGDSTIARASGAHRPLSHLEVDRPAVVVVLSDAQKERVIREALPHLDHAPKLVVAGYDHYLFRDQLFDDVLADLAVPSIANGYPHTLTHLFQCMVNAARLGLEGSLVEFGVFKGGTTMFLAKVAAALGRSWPVVGFDTFGGFPPRRSSLDMYDHPGAEFHDFEAVRRYLEPAGVELIAGDIAETASQLGSRPVVVAFVDTDNFASASAAIDALKDNVVPGGAIVFDHLTGVDRFRYTLGERMAAAALWEDERYFDLHATGVFSRQQ